MQIGSTRKTLSRPYKWFLNTNRCRGPLWCREGSCSWALDQTGKRAPDVQDFCFAPAFFLFELHSNRRDRMIFLDYIGNIVRKEFYRFFFRFMLFIERQVEEVGVNVCNFLGNASICMWSTSSSQKN